MEIYNVIGMNVGKYQISEANTTITMPDVKGQYFIKISGKDGSMQVKKMIGM